MKSGHNANCLAAMAADEHSLKISHQEKTNKVLHSRKPVLFILIGKCESDGNLPSSHHH